MNQDIKCGIINKYKSQYIILTDKGYVKSYDWEKGIVMDTVAYLDYAEMYNEKQVEVIIKYCILNKLTPRKIIMVERNTEVIVEIDLKELNLNTDITNVAMNKLKNMQ